MPPRRYSRHTFTLGVQDSAERLFLTERIRFGFKQLSDNRTHVVSQGETLFSLARRYFQGLPRPDGLWWVIGDFQPQPVHDPTLQLTPGSVVVIPSRRTVEELVFAESRRRET